MAMNVCDADSLETELIHIKKILHSNRYQTRFENSVLNRRLQDSNVARGHSTGYKIGYALLRRRWLEDLKTEKSLKLQRLV
ncbi:hypothetical protein M514_06344 [Trichuris suis]|nr:hypothetical protein M514_06344 [Trichuris suis]